MSLWELAALALMGFGSYMAGVLSMWLLKAQAESSLRFSTQAYQRAMLEHAKMAQTQANAMESLSEFSAGRAAMLGGLHALEKRVEKMDVTIGHLFLQIQEGQPTGRTPLRGQAIATGETLPPYPGTGQSRVRFPEAQKIEDGFEETPLASPGVVKNPPASALAEPS